MSTTFGSIETMPPPVLRAIHIRRGVMVMIDQKVLWIRLSSSIRWAL